MTIDILYFEGCPNHAPTLQVVRDVESGASYDITKDGKWVAQLIPCQEHSVPVIGFAKLQINEDIISPLPDHWTYDQHNLLKKNNPKKT